MRNRMEVGRMQGGSGKEMVNCLFMDSLVGDSYLHPVRYILPTYFLTTSETGTSFLLHNFISCWKVNKYLFELFSNLRLSCNGTCMYRHRVRQRGLAMTSYGGQMVFTRQLSFKYTSILTPFLAGWPDCRHHGYFTEMWQLKGIVSGDFWVLDFPSKSFSWRIGWQKVTAVTSNTLKVGNTFT